MLKPSIEVGQSTARSSSTLMMSWNQLADPRDMDLDRALAIKHETKSIGAGHQLLGETDRDFDGRSKLSNASAAADEAEVYPQNRMLQDSTGRLRKLTITE